MNLAVYKKKILNHKIYFILLSTTFVVGIVVGIFFNTYLERFFLSANVIDFYVNSLTGGGNLSGLFFAGLFADICVLLLFYGCSFVPFLFPLYFLILFYRGYVLGLAVGLLLGKFGVSGLMLFIFAVMISNVVTSFALIIFATATKSGFKKECKRGNDERNLCFLLCLAIVLVGAVAELVFMLFIIRPLNFNF